MIQNSVNNILIKTATSKPVQYTVNRNNRKGSLQYMWTIDKPGYYIILYYIITCNVFGLQIKYDLNLKLYIHIGILLILAKLQKVILLILFYKRMVYLTNDLLYSQKNGKSRVKHSFLAHYPRFHYDFVLFLACIVWKNYAR